jgi:hypothetical protein
MLKTITKIFDNISAFVANKNVNIKKYVFYFVVQKNY